MALLGREFIAVPDDRKGQIVFKHPDNNIRKYTRAIVDADELALFVNKGQVIGTLPPGQHQIDAQELPFLGGIIDWATGGNAYRAELFFVGTREYTGMPFGGRIDDVQDPQTGMIVTLRVFGDYALKVVDPGKLVLNLTGTVDVTNNDNITGWVSDQILKAMRTEVTRQIVRNGWPILGLSAYTPEIEQTVLDGGNQLIDPYGLLIARMGNFDVNLSEQDEAQLKTLAKDTAYSRLAGSFNAYAAGEAAIGAGEGMAKGGGATSGAFLAAGLGLGQQVAGSPPPGAGAPPPPAPGFAGGGPGFAGGGAGGAGAGVTCASCGTANAPGAKFCANCGTSLAPPTVACPNCHAENAATAKFCSSCGTAIGAPKCANCGTELAAGAKFCADCGTPVGAAPASAAPPSAG
ncbi:MAG TPA: SPFH domain-containing protein [Acidimicrobiales bacterium]|nr:SPFH domain-containing protein [Acidimicrobiales bacterium]